MACMACIALWYAVTATISRALLLADRQMRRLKRGAECGQSSPKS